MGLDLYGGTLTRYYSGRWLTIMQQEGLASGEPTTVLRSPDKHLDLEPSRALEAVNRWRTKVQNDLAAANALRDPFDWPEAVDIPYFTDKPGWECFGAMALLAAYTEAGLTPPAELPDGWEDDPVLRRMEAATNSPNVEVRYPNLYFVEWWLPVPDMAIFRSHSPVHKKPIRVASLPGMVDHLRDINKRTYAIPEELMENGLVDVALPPARRFEPLARAGLIITLNIAMKAVNQRVPMLLDF